jgi:RNA polymerase sigma-70 factor (ECF subfamily)
VALYQAIRRLTGNPVVRLNQALAVAMATAPEEGLSLLDDTLAKSLTSDHLFQSARADLLRRIGRRSEASVAYQSALDLVQNDPQRRYLARRLEKVTAEAT